MAYDLSLAERVRTILQSRSGVSERKMFGGIAFLVHGNMCCGVMKTDLMLRLPPDEVLKALERPHTRRMDFTGRPMKSMLYVDPAGTESDQELQDWVEWGYLFAKRMPRKAKAMPAR